MASASAPAPFARAITIFIVNLILLFQTTPTLSGDPDYFVLQPPQSSGDRHTMILPLFLASPSLSPNSSITSVGKYRRHLQGSTSAPQKTSRPNAHMRLYDDLLLNGYYTTRLFIGTPPQRFALIVDTGSTVTYVPCSTCEQCGRHQDPKFQPDLSTTYEPVKCNPDCTCDNDREQCTYDRQYAEMSSSSGVLGKDTISFGDESDLVPQRAIFGCENVETGDLYSQHADGIMGLGRGELSIVDQLVDEGVISDSFSLCYGGMDVGGGAMVLGGISPPPDMVFTNSDPVRSPYYNVELKAIQVAGKKLPLKPSVFDGKHGTVLDSGTTYAYLPEAAFLAFKEALMNELGSLKQIRGPDPNYHDICFSGGGSDVSELPKVFPTVDMVFGSGQMLSLNPENYLFRHSKVPGAYCLGVFQNGKDPTTLLGGIVVRNTLVIYDREHEKIGFWRTNCSQLWKNLHVDDAPPPLSNSNGTNSSNNIPPSMAPESSSLSSDHIFPGEIRVGLITFFMSLSIKYSDLKPHVTELTQLIAKELEVNTSQIHLLNLTEEGNGSLTKWGILPGSADYFPNATAMSIISRIAEQRMHLPQTFGSYKLGDWNIEPPKARTWWQQHYLAVVTPIVVTIIIGLSASLGWFVWKRRQDGSIPYRPVNDAISEQELQPL